MMTVRRVFANSEDDQGEQFNCDYGYKARNCDAKWKLNH